tara:strand:- start:4966 stop:5670 length:705 start_codon:yes stop_codon:yes gene_type:complete
MKVIILCGGKGTRISEETKVIPKPMIKVGGKPILIHIMDLYKKFGFNEFILALGYKSEVIKNYFKNKKNLNKKVKLVYTGKESLTGGRILRLKKYFKEGEDFMVTYGDGVSNLNIKKLLKFHLKHKKIATLTAVRPQLRFGELVMKKNSVKKFREKPQSDTGWVNGGFFIFKYKIFKYIKNDKSMLERKPLEKLAKEKQLMAYQHKSFWHCMDTLRDKIQLNNLIKNKKAPWIN